MRLSFALQNPMVWVVAVAAGLLAVVVHDRDARPFAFVRFAIASLLIAMALPLTTREQAWAPYSVYGLVVGAIAGVIQPVNAPPPRDESSEQLSETETGKARTRLISTGKGAVLGVLINVVLRFATYV